MSLNPIFNRCPSEVAPRILGWQLTCRGVKAEIVETEAYLACEDKASHARSGPTARAAVMFGPPSRAYIYRSYGIHLCFNIVCHRPESGGAILVRAGRVLEGEELARQRRGGTKGLADGPGKLAQCLALDISLNGTCLTKGPIQLQEASLAKPELNVVCGPRIGISQDVEKPFRFWLDGCSAVSRPRSGGIAI